MSKYEMVVFSCTIETPPLGTCCYLYSFIRSYDIFYIFHLFIYITLDHQCITVRQQTARDRFVHSSGLFLCTFFSIFHSCQFFNFAFFFHVVLFSCYNFFVLHSFCIALQSSCIISMLHFYMLHPFILQFFRVALCTCCTFVMPH